MSKEHLQVYLDEYVFRFNRRRTPMAAFQMLLGLGGQQNLSSAAAELRQKATTYRQIHAEGVGGRVPVLDPSIVDLQRLAERSGVAT